MQRVILLGLILPNGYCSLTLDHVLISVLLLMLLLFLSLFFSPLYSEITYMQGLARLRETLKLLYLKCYMTTKLIRLVALLEYLRVSQQYNHLIL